MIAQSMQQTLTVKKAFLKNFPTVHTAASPTALSPSVVMAKTGSFIPESPLAPSRDIPGSLATQLCLAKQ